MRSATLISERTRKAPLPWAPTTAAVAAASEAHLVVELDCRTLLQRCRATRSLWAARLGWSGGCSAFEHDDPPRRTLTVYLWSVPYIGGELPAQRTASPRTARARRCPTSSTAGTLRLRRETGRRVRPLAETPIAI